MPDDSAAALCRAALTRLPAAVPKIVRAIRQEIPEYATIPPREHIEHVLMLQEALLRALIEFRGPNEEDLERARNLGRLRAAQGISVEAVIGSYHISDRELWKLLESTAVDHREVLPTLATIMWETIGPISAAIADAHYAATRTAQARDVRLRYRLANLLTAGTADTEASAIAESLGFARDGLFVAALAGPANAEALSSLLSRTVRGTVVSAQWDDAALMICQGVDIDHLIDTIRAELPSAVLAVGMERPGLRGAADSVEDARLCLELADESAPVRCFESVWLAATLKGAGPRLSGLLAPGTNPAAEHPTLAATVMAFADCAFSVTTTARALSLHPNTVTYRLNRWQTLTGWDPRTLDGVARSLLADSLTGTAQETGRPVPRD